MFVVMAAGATEAEVLGVKGLILAEGLTPFENAGADRTRDRGRRRDRRRASRVLRRRLAALPGVADGDPDQPSRSS